MKLCIDVRTKDLPEIIRRLRRLNTTQEVSDGGAYRVDTSYSQIHIDTTWSVPQLDGWLCQQAGIDYVGVFVRKENDHD